MFYIINVAYKDSLISVLTVTTYPEPVDTIEEVANLVQTLYINV